MMSDVEKATVSPESGRRSRRLALKTSMKSPEHDAQASTASDKRGPRRNPKRRSSQVSSLSFDLPDDLLAAAYEPVTEQERDEWEGWVELESDPASFNHILRELGIQGVQVQELFSIDQESLDLLPKAVHGLIFLFQYQPETVEEHEDAQDNDVWFANQTSNNACATVALLNIAMNIKSLQMGKQLQDFKAETLPLSPPLRGDRLTVNSFIRSKHNSFASRIDLLDVDLRLDNNIETTEKKSKRRSGPKKGRRSASRPDEYAFHFIAYVSANGSVWELDGLKPSPNKLGPVSSSDWTSIARPYIEARMMQYAESQLTFNLLALCQTPLGSHRQQIADSLASLIQMRVRMGSNEDFKDLVSGEEQPLDVQDRTQMAEYGLQPSDIGQGAISDESARKLSRPDLELGDTYDMYLSFIARTKQAMRAYEGELRKDSEATKQKATPSAPWGPAIHKLVTALADKDELLGIIRHTS